MYVRSHAIPCGLIPHETAIEDLHYMENSQLPPRICSKPSCKNILPDEDKHKTCQRCCDRNRTGEADQWKKKREEATEPPIRQPPASREQAEGESGVRVGIDAPDNSIMEDTLGTVSNSFQACYLIKELKDNKKIHLKMGKPCLILSTALSSIRRILYSMAITL